MRTWVGWAVLAGSLWAQSAGAQVANEGRLLASGCFQCHGTSGLKGGFGTLAGVGKEDMLNKLNNDMRTKDARSSIMNPHARGYTSYQLSLIADYFSKLPKP
jgi:sulfide dehydrogenase cytochrome subunit